VIIAARAREANGVKTFRAAFLKIKASFDAQPTDREGLVCKQGFYNQCAVLKLQKASWTNDRMDQVRNETGIFFSVWIDREAAAKRRTNYNIHALKLRQLRGYTIASRDFADEFRNHFASMRGGWPNVSVDHGPLTLMQGWIEFDLKSLEEDILGLLERFTMVSPLIDRLLESRRRRA
jgi:hypothetical protein